MYMTHHIFTVLPINHFVNQDGETTMPHKLGTGTKPSVSNMRVLFCPFVVKKLISHVDGNALNMRHQLQKGVQGISAVITQYHKGCLVYIPST